MRIARVRALPISFPLPPDGQVSLGIGRTIKRDAVLVRVDTDTGLTGWGEAHAARAPSAIAELVNTTLAQLVTGMDALDTEAVWARVYRMQLASHGCGAAAVIGLSGIDLALWDLKGRAAGQPVHALLGASARALPVYAGGIALGFAPPARLVEEALALIAAGHRALKLRVGERPDVDLARVRAVRDAVGPDVALMVDANTAYDLAAVDAVAPALAELGVRWLEEPFPAHDYRSYRAAAGRCPLPLAAGENHYTRFDFERLLDDGAITVWQPDLSKCGGLTEALRIAALAAGAGLAVHPHTSVTGLNMAATLHFLCAIPNAGYFEADASLHNPFRDLVCPAPRPLAGVCAPPAGSGLGVTVDRAELGRFPVQVGAGYV